MQSRLQIKYKSKACLFYISVYKEDDQAELCNLCSPALQLRYHEAPRTLTNTNSGHRLYRRESQLSTANASAIRYFIQISVRCLLFVFVTSGVEWGNESTVAYMTCTVLLLRQHSLYISLLLCVVWPIKLLFDHEHPDVSRHYSCKDLMKTCVSVWHLKHCPPHL